MAKIKWKGGKCPVSEDDIVRVWLSSGDDGEYYAHSWNWEHYGNDGDIIAYEVIEEAKEEPKQITEKTLRDEFAIAWIKGGHQPSYDAYIFADSMMKASMK